MAKNNKKLAKIRAFRAGQQTDSLGKPYTFSRADLVAMANAYNASDQEAPLTLGHPTYDAPAYGWIKHAEANGDYLDLEVEPTAAAEELVRSEEYKYCSLAIWPPGHDSNPTPETIGIRHLGMLGGAAPAVPNLPRVTFAAEEGAVRFDIAEDVRFSFVDAAAAPPKQRRWAFRDIKQAFQNLREHLISEKGLDFADKILPSWLLENIRAVADSSGEFSATRKTKRPDKMPDNNLMTEEELRAGLAELKKGQAALDKDKADFAAEKIKSAAEANAAADERWLDEHIAAGEIPPGKKMEFAALLAGTHSAAPIEFAAEGGGVTKKSANEVMRQTLLSKSDTLPRGRIAGARPANFAAAAVVPNIALPCDRPGIAPNVGETLHLKKVAELRNANPGMDFSAAHRAVLYGTVMEQQPTA